MADRPARVVQYGETMVQLWPDCILTVLPGGAQVCAAPQDNDAYRATARRLGYGSNTARMCWEHELTHSALAAWLGMRESPTMRHVADRLGDTILTGLEEEAVMAIQRYANAAGIDLLRVLSR